MQSGHADTHTFSNIAAVMSPLLPTNTNTTRAAVEQTVAALSSRCSARPQVLFMSALALSPTAHRAPSAPVGAVKVKIKDTQKGTNR